MTKDIILIDWVLGLVSVHMMLMVTEMSQAERELVDYLVLSLQVQ